MKQSYYVGVFTYDGEYFTTIREYSSLNNAEKFFAKYCVKNGHKVIFSSASLIVNFSSLDEFSHEVLESSYYRILQRCYELFGKQSKDK